MATRWELMKAAWKKKKPVPTATIVSDIKASAVKTLQPAVEAGKKFRETHPEAAEKISRTGVATQIRTSVQIRKDIKTSKHNVIVARDKVNVLGSRIESAPIRNGVFVGTDSEFNQYKKDVRNYNTNVNRFNSENKRIETLEGKKLYPTLERMVSTKIPTLSDVSKKGAAFRRKHPTVAAGIYKTFDKAHARTERVGSDSQRSALAGYTYGSYSSLQQKPVKTVASFAVGGTSAKAVKMIGAVGKAHGAGKWSKRMTKAVQYGILAYYGKKASEHIMSAPNAYEAGRRAADIMYTEILPMSAGVRAVGGKVKTKTVETKPSTSADRLLGIAETADFRKPPSLGAKIKHELTSSRLRTVEMMQNDFARAGLVRGGPRIRRGKLSDAQFKARKKRWAKKEAVKLEKFVEKAKLRRAESKKMWEKSRKEPFSERIKKREKEIEAKLKSGEWSTREVKQAGSIRKTVDGRSVVTPSSVSLQVVEAPLKTRLKAPPKQVVRLLSPAEMEKYVASIVKLRAELIKTPVQLPATKTKIARPITKPVTRTAKRTVVRTKELTIQEFASRMATAVGFMYIFGHPPSTKIGYKPITSTAMRKKLAIQEKVAIRQTEQLAIPQATRITPAVATTPVLTISEATKYIERIAEMQRTITAMRIAPVPPVPPIYLKAPEPKKKMKKKVRKVTTLSQKNLNVVATFRDLLGGL